VEKRSLLKLAKMVSGCEIVSTCSRAFAIYLEKPLVNSRLFPEIQKEVFMDKKGMKKINITSLIIATVLAAVLIQVNQVQADDEKIEVACYRGNLDEGNFIGNLTVNDPRNAGHDCNLEYYDCKGECVGCLTDSDSKQVCYDDSGTKLAK
jgi:hypothetical protein